MNPFPTAQRLSRSDLLLVAAYWLVVAPILLVQYAADTGRGWVRALPEVGATALFDTVTVALVVGILLPLFLRRWRWLALGLLPVFVLLSGWLTSAFIVPCGAMRPTCRGRESCWGPWPTPKATACWRYC